MPAMRAPRIRRCEIRARRRRKRRRAAGPTTWRSYRPRTIAECVPASPPTRRAPVHAWPRPGITSPPCRYRRSTPRRRHWPSTTTTTTTRNRSCSHSEGLLVVDDCTLTVRASWLLGGCYGHLWGFGGLAGGYVHLGMFVTPEPG